MDITYCNTTALVTSYSERISNFKFEFEFGFELKFLNLKDTMAALESGAVETLIVWENVDVNRYTLMNASSGEVLEFRAPFWVA